MSNPSPRCLWPSKPRKGLTCVQPSTDPDTGQEVGQPALATHGHLCPGHYAKLERTVSELPTALAAVQDTSPSMAASMGEIVSGSRDRKDAIRVGVFDCREQLQVAQGWTAEMIAGRLDVAQIADHLTSLVNRAHAVRPWRPSRRNAAIRCPYCSMSTVMVPHGEDDGVCDTRQGGCGLAVDGAVIDGIVYAEQVEPQVRAEREAKMRGAA